MQDADDEYPGDDSLCLFINRSLHMNEDNFNKKLNHGQSRLMASDIVFGQFFSAHTLFCCVILMACLQIDYADICL